MDENLASAYNEVGVGYMMNRMFDEGKESCLKSLHVYRSLENYSSVMTGFPSANLGLAYMNLGDLDKAIEVLEAGLRDQEDTFGQNDIESEKYTPTQFVPSLLIVE
jgi:tetratricopeptide (TPR) repeat protein